MTIDAVKAVLALVEHIWIPALLIVAALAAAGRFALRARKKRSRAADRKHRWMQARSRETITTLRQLAPLQNPARAFGFLRAMNPYLFEEVILSELELRELVIERNASYSGDGGIDGKFYLGGKLWLVQAKRYKQYVKKQHVWAFDAVCKEYRANGLFVHTGKTPKDLLELQRQCGVVRIISGDELLQLFSGHAVKLEVTKPAAPTTPPAGGETATAAAA